MTYILVIGLVLQFVIIHALWQRLVDLRGCLELHAYSLKKIWESEALRPELRNEYYSAIGQPEPDDMPKRSMN